MQQSSIFAVNALHRPQEEGDVVRGIAIVLAITGALAVSGIAAPAPAQAGRLASTPYGCPATGPTLGTRHPTPIRHIFTVTPRIAEELASTFTLDLHITAIGTADPDISIIGITAGIVIGKAIVVAITVLVE